MFGSLGMPEILAIMVLALLVFGPRRLPEVGRTLGKGLAEFRRASADLKRTVNAEIALEDAERTPAPRRPGLAASPPPEPFPPASPPASTTPRGVPEPTAGPAAASASGADVADPGDPAPDPAAAPDDGEPVTTH